MRIKILFFLFFYNFVCIINVKSQIVYENINSGVYEFLDRMSHKGYINYFDVIKPLNRTYIHKLLNEIKVYDTVLTEIEYKEINFYLREYSITNIIEKDTIKKFILNRTSSPIFFSAKSADNYINFSPVLHLFQNKHNNRSFYQYASGINIWGRLGKHIGFNISYKDIIENRDELVNDSIINNSSPGFTLLTKELNKTKLINFAEYRASIGYEWKNGFLSFGQDNFTWGYGSNGKIVLSEKSPFNQYIRLNYKPFKWLIFDYSHHWLNSNFIDSNNSYNYENSIYGGNRLNYVPKYLSTHTLTFVPIKGINLSFGESIVYTDKLDIGFLNPIQFFKVYDNNKSLYEILNGNNGQLFFQLSLRNILPKTHFYSSLFIDEVKLTKMFNKNESRNQIGFNIGTQLNDIVLPYLALYLDYTRVNPFVYNNLNPAQSYTSFGYNLGDWVGNNFDRKIAGLKYTPFPRLRLDLRYQNIRKGPEYSLEEQYLEVPTKKFLEYIIRKQRQLSFNINYELNNNIYFISNYNYTESHNNTINTMLFNHNFNFGFKIGL